MAKILDGVAQARLLRAELAARVAANKLAPGLAVVLVGDNAASQVYVRNKTRAAEECGIRSETHRLAGDTTQSELLDMVARLNGDSRVNGILIQLPLPPQIDSHTVIAAIDPDKDVDGFHPVNAGRLALGLPSLTPCTPQGCMILLRAALPDLAGRRALMIGSSNIVGKPMAQLLLQAHATVTIAHSKTRDLADEVRRSEVIVVAIGKPNFIQGAWIAPGATVIDVGINRVADPADPAKSRLVGDVAFDDCGHAAAITPVPGGVGPMTIACLMKNTVQAAENAR